MSFDPPYVISSSGQIRNNPERLQPHRYKTWREAEGQKEIRVRLDRVPKELNFDDDFPEPIRFDPAHKQLIYRGFMSSKSYAFLRQVSSDLNYLGALDQIYVNSAQVLRPGKSRRRLWPRLAAVGAAVTIVALSSLWFLR